MSPDGKNIYADNRAARGRYYEEKLVSVFNRDPNTGALAYATAIENRRLIDYEYDWGYRGSSVTTSPDGKHVYLVFYGGCMILSRDASNGLLTEIAINKEIINRLYLSPDGAGAYAFSPRSFLGVFNRNPADGNDIAFNPADMRFSQMQCLVDIERK